MQYFILGTQGRRYLFWYASNNGAVAIGIFCGGMNECHFLTQFQLRVCEVFQLKKIKKMTYCTHCSKSESEPLVQGFLKKKK